MAVTPRAVTITRGASPITPAAPGDVAVGDWVQMAVLLRGGTAASLPTPAGWTAAGGSPYTSGGAVVNTDLAVYLFRRKWDGVWAMPSLAWTGDGTNSGTAMVRAFGGADPTDPNDVAPVASSAAFTANTSAVLSALNTVTPGAFVWHLFGANSGVTGLTVPDTSDASNLNRPTIGVGNAGAQASAGTTGTKTYSWTGGANAAYVGLVLAIRPAPAPTVHQLGATLQGVGDTSPTVLKPARRLAGTLQGVAQITAGLTVVAAGGRGPEDYETAVGPMVQVAAMSRRASMYVTTPEFPGTVIPPPGSTMKAGLYLGRGATQPPNASMPHQADGTSRTTRLDDWNAAGDPPPSPGNFPAGTPATLATEDGTPLIRSNGLPRMKAAPGGAAPAQSIPNDTVTQVVLGSEVSDTENGFDPATGIYTAPFGGQWLVLIKVQFTQGNGVGYRQGMAQFSTDGGANWTNTAVAAHIGAAPGTSTEVMASGLVDQTGGRLLRLACRHTDGAALNLGSGCYLELVFMGPS